MAAMEVSLAKRRSGWRPGEEGAQLMLSVGVRAGKEWG